MNSPLGKYTEVVAAVIATSIIAAYIVAVFGSRLLELQPADLESLKVLALIALGAVFGSAATINGVRQPIDSAHNRIDHIESATGIQTHGSYPVPFEGIDRTAER